MSPGRHLNTPMLKNVAKRLRGLAQNIPPTCNSSQCTEESCATDKGWYSLKRPSSTLTKLTFLMTYPYLFSAPDIECTCSRRLQHVADMRSAPVVSLVYMVGIHKIVFQLPTENPPPNSAILCTYVYQPVGVRYTAVQCKRCCRPTWCHWPTSSSHSDEGSYSASPEHGPVDKQALQTQVSQ